MNYYNISVIIPVYNGEAVIARAVDSVLKQGLKNIQIIIVNDGSTDGTKHICESLQLNNPKILFLSQNNQGVSAARNLGLKNAEGKYVIFLDADDQLEKDFCEKMLKKIESEKADLVICGYNVICENEKYEWKPSGFWNHKQLDSKKEIIDKLIQFGGINMLWNKMFVKEKINQEFNLKENMGEDLEFVANYLDGVEKISVVDSCLYNYTGDNKSSLTHVIDISPQILLYEYNNILHIIKHLSLNLEKFKDRLVFRTCDQFYNPKYSEFLKKWKYFRKMDGFIDLVNCYQPSKKIYKIIAFLIKNNYPFLVYILLKCKNI